MALSSTVSSIDAKSLSERCAGRLLGRLGPRGYVVLADGVVVGPTGVVVVTTLTCTERLRVHHGELWQGRFPVRRQLAQGARRALDVERIVGALDPSIPVRSIVCVLGSAVPGDPYCVLGVELCGPAELPDRIEAGRRALTFDEVLRLAKDVDPARRRRAALRAAGRRVLRQP
jgi:hypothetical protein